MPITKTWKKFGDAILASPYLTLAAFLGHPASMVDAKKQKIRFPTAVDFQNDPNFDPNFHKLDLDEGYVNNKFLLLCVSVWGAEPLKLAVNACSLLQCIHQGVYSSELKRLRNKAAFALQNYLDNPTFDCLQVAEKVRQECEAKSRPFEDDPDNIQAHDIWYQLGAPWFGLETVLGNLDARTDCGEEEPAPANSSWCNRNTVWPERAIDAAAHWSSHSLAGDVVRSALTTWAISNLARTKSTKHRSRKSRKG